MKIYDKCPGCDESVLGRKPVTMFECRSWIGLDGVLTETNTCLRRQLAQMQERAEASEAVVEKLRLERDMLALNRDPRNSSVMSVIGLDGNVKAIIWSSVQSGSEARVQFPPWYLELAESAKPPAKQMSCPYCIGQIPANSLTCNRCGGKRPPAAGKDV